MTDPEIHSLAIALVQEQLETILQVISESGGADAERIVEDIEERTRNALVLVEAVRASIDMIAS
jgi:hypothetical protein